MPESFIKKKSIGILEWLFTGVIAFIILYFIFQFAFIFLRINSNDMAETAYKGSVVLIDKTKLGGRLPITPLGLPFTEIYNENWILKPQRINKGKLALKDILVFNDPLADSLPIDRRPIKYSRLIGLPGDTVKVHYGRIYRNNLMEKRGSSLLFSYKLKFSKADSSVHIIQNHRIYAAATLADSTEWVITSTYNNAIALAAENSVVGFEAILFTDPLQDELFPGNIFAPFSLDDYGPMWIPQKGDTVEIGMDNFALYKQIIEEDQSGKFHFHNDSLFLNEIYSPNYIFKQNFYFVMGDNRHHSYDSRNFGFLPESAIIGVVKKIWNSNPPETHFIKNDEF